MEHLRRFANEVTAGNFRSGRTPDDVIAVAQRLRQG